MHSKAPNLRSISEFGLIEKMRVYSLVGSFFGNTTSNWLSAGREVSTESQKIVSPP